MSGLKSGSARVLAVARLDDEARHDAVEHDVCCIVTAAGQGGEGAAPLAPSEASTLMTIVPKLWSS